MANWYGSARSSYFRVRNEEEFRAWVEKRELQILFEDKGRFAIAPADSSDTGGWSNWEKNPDPNPDAEELIAIDFIGELTGQLAEGEVAVIMETGAQKLSYLTGNAVAVHSSGETVSLDLNNIYALAAERFNVDPETIKAEY